jgi:16S rRNA (cytosine967-C5)-methyltransferase
MQFLFTHTEYIIHAYDGVLPLSHYFKQYFKQHPKLGSRDRRLISEMVYCYFRTAHLLSGNDVSIAQKVQLSLVICKSKVKGLNRVIDKELQDLLSATFEKVKDYCQTKQITFNNIWQFSLRLSEGINCEIWSKHLLAQPKLFIRVAKPEIESVVQVFTQANIDYQQMDALTFSLPNTTNLDQLLKPYQYKIQDASSQETSQYFSAMQKGQSCWDCCSGAGGKSLLIAERDVKLIVSDLRESILSNLKKRFQLYGLPIPASKVISLIDNKDIEHKMGNQKFDHIVADVPCSGSGTWGRTPEQLLFFKEENLATYAERQKRIVNNVLPYLKAGGLFYYITCSVFYEENESVVNFMLDISNGLEVVSQQLIDGSNIGADSMFITVLKKIAV